MGYHFYQLLGIQKYMIKHQAFSDDIRLILLTEGMIKLNVWEYDEASYVYVNNAVFLSM